MDNEPCFSSVPIAKPFKLLPLVSYSRLFAAPPASGAVKHQHYTSRVVTGIILVSPRRQWPADEWLLLRHIDNGRNATFEAVSCEMFTLPLLSNRFSCLFVFTSIRCINTCGFHRQPRQLQITNSLDYVINLPWMSTARDPTVCVLKCPSTTVPCSPPPPLTQHSELITSAFRGCGLLDEWESEGAP